jgi:hypothetical protein
LVGTRPSCTAASIRHPLNSQRVVTLLACLLYNRINFSRVVVRNFNDLLLAWVHDSRIDLRTIVDVGLMFIECLTGPICEAIRNIVNAVRRLTRLHASNAAKVSVVARDLRRRREEHALLAARPRY